MLLSHLIDPACIIWLFDRVFFHQILTVIAHCQPPEWACLSVRAVTGCLRATGLDNPVPHSTMKELSPRCNLGHRGFCLCFVALERCPISWAGTITPCLLLWKTAPTKNLLRACSQSKSPLCGGPEEMGSWGEER